MNRAELSVLHKERQEKPQLINLDILDEKLPI